MKNSILTITALFLLLSTITTSAFAQVKTIILKDGSQVKGEITSMTDGVYTIKSETFGEVSVKDADILSISTGGPASVGAQPALQMPQMQAPAQMQGQITDMQKTFMNDPAMMQQVEQLMNNPEIMKLISDPQFMQDLMTYDPSRIENNPNTQQLMNNPEFKQLMDNATDKFSTGETQATEE